MKSGFSKRPSWPSVENEDWRVVVMSQERLFFQELGAFYTKENIWQHQYLTNRESSDLTFIDLFVFQIALIFAKKTNFSHEWRSTKSFSSSSCPTFFPFLSFVSVFWGDVNVVFLVKSFDTFFILLILLFLFYFLF